MIIKLKNIREYKKKIKMKFINFETLIDSFHRFFSKNQPLNFNNDLMKTFIKTF